MITLIHGTDIVSSRKFFFQEKNSYPDSQILDGEKITLTDLTQILEGGGLFGEQKTIFIEGLFIKKKGRTKKSETTKTEFEILTDYLKKQTSHTIVLWEGKELDKSALLTLPTAVPRVFKLPQTLFVLLDGLKPNNGNQLVTLFHTTLETTDAEMIFFMLVRHFRLMLGLLEPASEQIDELKRLAPWQKSKLEQQAKAFGRENLLKLYAKLFTIEIGQKTGTLPNTILTSIDFFLLGI